MFGSLRAHLGEAENFRDPSSSLSRGALTAVAQVGRGGCRRLDKPSSRQKSGAWRWVCTCVLSEAGLEGTGSQWARAPTGLPPRGSAPCRLASGLKPHALLPCAPHAPPGLGWGAAAVSPGAVPASGWPSVSTLTAQTGKPQGPVPMWRVESRPPHRQAHVTHATLELNSATNCMNTVNSAFWLSRDSDQVSQLRPEGQTQTSA